MTNIKVIHFDLDGLLWLPEEFLDTTLRRCIHKGIESGLNADFKTSLKKLKRIRKKLGSNSKEHFNELCRCLNGEDNERIVSAMHRTYHKSKLSNMVPVTNVENVLDSLLREGYILTIVSNGLYDKQMEKLDDLNLSHYFKYTAIENGIIKVKDTLAWISDDKPELEKPNPYMWEKVRGKIKRHYGKAFFKNEKGEETRYKEVHVGDRLYVDVFGANLQGMISIRINQGKYQDESHEYGAIEDKIEENFGLHGKNGKLARKLMMPDFEIDELRELPAHLQKAEAGYSKLIEKKKFLIEQVKKMEVDILK